MTKRNNFSTTTLTKKNHKFQLSYLPLSYFPKSNSKKKKKSKLFHHDIIGNNYLKTTPNSLEPENSPGEILMVVDDENGIFSV